MEGKAMMTTLYSVVTPEGVQWRGDSLTQAVRIWDGLTCNAGRLVPGGIQVESVAGGLMVRDGWILHVHPDGSVYLSTSVVGE